MAEVREYPSGDYRLLYSVGADASRARCRVTVHLLAIRHHRHVEGFWRGSRAEER